jgi:NifU-like protein involved in Fe-S cluster formation
LRDPKNLGELAGADAVGTAGSAACGDMIRLWIKFKEEAGKKVVDRATFQSFGCETAIAVASLATEMIRGKTAEEVLAMSAEELAPAWARCRRSKSIARNWWKAPCAPPCNRNPRPPPARRRSRRRAQPGG